jgi:hypothetical protein
MKTDSIRRSIGQLEDELPRPVDRQVVADDALGSKS